MPTQPAPLRVAIIGTFAARTISTEAILRAHRAESQLVAVCWGHSNSAQLGWVALKRPGIRTWTKAGETAPR